MSFQIVKRSPQSFGGLVVPDVDMRSVRSDGGLLEFTRERLLDRGIAEIGTVYVAHGDHGWSAVVGYPCADPADLATGDVLVRVPGGYFAMFTADGLVEDPVEDVWLQAETAEKEGSIDRAFVAELEVVHPTKTVELFVSLT